MADEDSQLSAMVSKRKANSSCSTRDGLQGRACPLLSFLLQILLARRPVAGEPERLSSCFRLSCKRSPPEPRDAAASLPIRAAARQLRLAN
jgi:hypothetical protein